MNPQPVSLADQLRKLVETWREFAATTFPYGTADAREQRGILGAERQRARDDADELSALLAQHAVAEPQVCPICKKPLSSGISWCKTCEVTHAVSCVECHPCGYINEAPCELGKPAHAAEQPKLTEPFRTEHLEVLLSGRFGISSVTGAADLAWLADQLNKLRSLLIIHPLEIVREVRDILWEHAKKSSDCGWAGNLGDRLAALLTSPVAPPPPRFAQMIGGTWAGHNKGVHNENSFCRLAGCHAAPPVAPGEQPPQIGSWLQALQQAELEPPAQERASHHFIQGFLWAECSCGWRSVICAHQECNELFAEHLAAQPSPQTKDEFDPYKD